MEDLKEFQKQLQYTPEVTGSAPGVEQKEVVICGMGGSHLAGDILQAWSNDIESPVSDLRFTIWSDYDLPPLHHVSTKDVLVVVTSHSGNTEEAISAFKAATQAGLSVATVTSGGALLSLAEQEQAPRVVLPGGDIQPRISIGYMLRATLALLGREGALSHVANISNFNNEELMKKGEELAGRLRERIPVVYSETRNWHLAYYWKIALNETGKVPAFYNVLPEANHNELEGLMHAEETPPFYALFLEDGFEHPRVTQRIATMSRVYGKQDIRLSRVAVQGSTVPERAFYSLLLASWTAHFTAKQRGEDPEAVPVIEEFKGLL